ncbi:MAG: hypothetical protein IPM74_02155 [Crocinitomicaceae bacterium]|nr:hypothetical protein [Crocinitomicaceae bacterium]MBK8924719.1 hypothetical protein [Crocinitomicaceae bacterium]
MKTNKINVVLSLNKTVRYSSSVNRYANEEARINGSNNIIRANGTATATQMWGWIQDPAGNGSIPWVDPDTDISYGSSFGSGASKVTG